MKYMNISTGATEYFVGLKYLEIASHVSDVESFIKASLCPFFQKIVCWRPATIVKNFLLYSFCELFDLGNVWNLKDPKTHFIFAQSFVGNLLSCYSFDDILFIHLLMRDHRDLNQGILGSLSEQFTLWKLIHKFPSWNREAQKKLWIHKNIFRAQGGFPNESDRHLLIVYIRPW